MDESLTTGLNHWNDLMDIKKSENQYILENITSHFQSFIVKCPVGTTSVEAVEENQYYKGLIWKCESEGLEDL